MSWLIFKNYFFNRAIGARVISVLMMLAMQATFARVLTGHEFGLVQLVLSLNFLFAYIVTLGIPFSLLRSLPMEKAGMTGPGASPSLFSALSICAGSTFFFILVVGILNSMTGFFSKFMGLSDLEFSWAAAFLAIFALNYSLSEVFRAWGRVILANLSVGFGMTTVVVLCCWTLKLSGSSLSLLNALQALFAGAVISFAYSLWRLRSNLLVSRRHAPLSFRAHLQKAWPFFLNLLIVYALSQVDFWLVFYRLGAESGGAYTQVLKLVQFFGLYQTAILASVPQQVVTSYKRGDYENVLRVNNRIATVSVVLLILPCLLYLGFGGSILKIIYASVRPGQEFSLALLALAQVIVQACGPQALILSLIGEIRLVNLISLGSLALIATLGLLSPFINISTMAILASSVTVASQIFLRFFFSLRLRNQSALRQVNSPAVNAQTR